MHAFLLSKQKFAVTVITKKKFMSNHHVQEGIIRFIIQKYITAIKSLAAF